MKIASNGGIPKSSVARADVHCFLFRPCAIPPVCLVDATRPRRARRGPEARAPRENSMCSSSSTGEHHRCRPEARAPPGKLDVFKQLYQRTSPMRAGGPCPPGKLDVFKQLYQRTSPMRAGGPRTQGDHAGERWSPVNPTET